MTISKEPRDLFEIFQKEVGIILNRHIITSIGENGEKLEPLSIAGRMKNAAAPLEKSLAGLQQMFLGSPYFQQFHSYTQEK